jgi:NAD-dependent deacetylase
MTDWHTISEALKNYTDWHTASETLKNFAEIAAILAGAFALWQWRIGRYDRGTDVLLELEKKFNEPECLLGRASIEDDVAYGNIVGLMHTAVLEAVEPVPLTESTMTPEENERLGPVDSLLRFYVLMHGIRRARQVRDLPLKTCFRYWLTQYYCPYRPAFRAYVDTFFPTLKQWLHDDAKRWRKSRRFFTPADFDWEWDERKKEEQFRRAIGGRVLVITGSGISADSGIPTFRGPDGYWLEHRPQELATRKAFEADPAAIWKWYSYRREKIRDTKPNAAHDALVKLAPRCKEILVLTQNVDDLHERARFNGEGLSKDQVVHIHGQIFVTQCSSCNHKYYNSGADEFVPRCSKCGALVRPGVVWFDEELDPHEESRVNRFLRRGPCDLVLLIGTTATFDYIRNWALKAAGHSGWLVEIDPEETCLSTFANHAIRQKAAEVLPPLIHSSIEKGQLGLGVD